MPTTVVRILGGAPAKTDEFPWMAALGHLNSELKVEFNCGGTLISNNFVLTAAHCVKHSLRLVLVRLGKQNLTDGTEAVDRTIEDIITHPDYSAMTKLNDIALIRIKAVKFAKNVIPACLQMDVRDMPSNEPLIVTGWGSVSAERTNKSSTLLKTQLKTMPIAECSSTLLSNRTSNLSSLKNITNGQYCAFDPNAQNDSCQGDSGGPLQTFTDDSSISTVVGIVSFGISCGTAMPAVYTRVAYYLDWIESIVWPNTEVFK
ncbi:serine protease persephone-like [Sitodiplosis mosellana]|uniref:serine protease persephone-like n=1 Tax=Sitodiplosis mosellana TaxID=263140 RepID=UPI0024443A8C|nr:serine protease persephone-like [Sitodiplosis mosellana]